MEMDPGDIEMLQRAIKGQASSDCNSDSSSPAPNDVQSSAAGSPSADIDVDHALQLLADSDSNEDDLASSAQHEAPVSEDIPNQRDLMKKMFDALQPPASSSPFVSQSPAGYQPALTASSNTPSTPLKTEGNGDVQSLTTSAVLVQGNCPATQPNPSATILPEQPMMPYPVATPASGLVPALDTHSARPQPDVISASPLDPQTPRVTKDAGGSPGSRSARKGRPVQTPDNPRDVQREADKERIREENRERKKRWRGMNGERNKDNDLRCRVTKRAHKMWGPEDSEQKRAWMQEEFDKRRAKREQKEKAKTNDGPGPNDGSPGVFTPPRPPPRQVYHPPPPPLPRPPQEPIQAVTQLYRLIIEHPEFREQLRPHLEAYSAANGAESTRGSDTMATALPLSQQSRDQASWGETIGDTHEGMDDQAKKYKDLLAKIQSTVANYGNENHETTDLPTIDDDQNLDIEAILAMIQQSDSSFESDPCGEFNRGQKSGSPLCQNALPINGDSGYKASASDSPHSTAEDPEANAQSTFEKVDLDPEVMNVDWPTTTSPHDPPERQADKLDILTAEENNAEKELPQELVDDMTDEQLDALLRVCANDGDEEVSGEAEVRLEPEPQISPGPAPAIVQESPLPQPLQEAGRTAQVPCGNQVHSESPRAYYTSSQPTLEPVLSSPGISPAPSSYQLDEEKSTQVTIEMVTSVMRVVLENFSPVTRGIKRSSPSSPYQEEPTLKRAKSSANSAIVRNITGILEANGIDVNRLSLYNQPANLHSASYAASFGNSSEMNKKLMAIKPPYRPGVSTNGTNSISPGIGAVVKERDEQHERKIKAMGFPPLLAGLKK